MKCSVGAKSRPISRGAQPRILGPVFRKRWTFQPWKVQLARYWKTPVHFKCESIQTPEWKDHFEHFIWNYSQYWWTFQEYLIRFCSYAKISLIISNSKYMLLAIGSECKLDSQAWNLFCFKCSYNHSNSIYISKKCLFVVINISTYLLFIVNLLLIDLR